MFIRMIIAAVIANTICERYIPRYKEAKENAIEEIRKYIQ